MNYLYSNKPDFIHRIYSDIKSNLEAALWGSFKIELLHSYFSMILPKLIAACTISRTCPGIFPGREGFLK